MISRSKRSRSRASSAASRQAGPFTPSTLPDVAQLVTVRQYAGLPNSRDAKDLVKLGQHPDIGMMTAGDPVQTLERGRPDLQRRPLGRRERCQEERRARSGRRRESCTMLDLLGIGPLVDRHLDVDVAPGCDGEPEAGLVLVPTRTLAGVAGALEVEADDRGVREHALEQGGEDCGRLERYGEIVPAVTEAEDDEVDLHQRGTPDG